VGRLASSPLATATAISALVLAEQHGRSKKDDEYLVYQADLSELIVNGLFWLAQHQNDDGGWGDTDRCRSNIATTMLVRAAFCLTGEPVKYRGLLQRAESYVKSQGGVAALFRRYGKDKTFAVPILTNCALAGLVDWRDVPPLPFELACLPQSMYRRLRLPVVSYAIPALVAIGAARFHYRPPINPITRLVRSATKARSLEVLTHMQPDSGGFLEAVPLTSFVVMGLASIGEAEHEVVRRSVEYLLGAARPDGSWPIDTNLATWNTSLAIGALVRGHVAPTEDWSEHDRAACLDWLLDCQHTESHPMTGAAPGGWAWTDLSGGVPDTDDTAAALLALRAMLDASVPGDGVDARRERIVEAARRGVIWLLDVQNDDGGWPTFCRGWGRLPFDRSGVDLSANAMRALHAWRAWPRETIATEIGLSEKNKPAQPNPATIELSARIAAAIDAGRTYVLSQQHDDGSWTPLWFGNQENADEENRIYGTSRVLVALRGLGELSTAAAKRATDWLVSVQHVSGGWGAIPHRGEQSASGKAQATRPVRTSAGDSRVSIALPCSVEETAWAVEALSGNAETPATHAALEEGLDWLVRAVNENRHRDAAPVGFYFAKLWYYERLYPVLFATAALSEGIRRRGEWSEPAAERQVVLPYRPPNARTPS